MIAVKRVGDHALDLPRRGSAYAAGIDLSSAVTWVVYPGEQVLIPTGFAWAIPHGHVGVIKDRSGLASKRQVYTAAGVIDSDYRGEVMALIRNRGEECLKIAKGDRIAQMLVVPCLLADIEEVAELDETVRGAGGFGSTGVA